MQRVLWGEGAGAETTSSRGVKSDGWIAGRSGGFI